MLTKKSSHAFRKQRLEKLTAKLYATVIIPENTSIGTSDMMT